MDENGVDTHLDERPPRGRPWWLRILAGVLVLAACSLAAWPVLSGKTAPPELTLQSATRSLDRARQAEAARWAKDALLKAESALRAARAEYRCQEVRFVLLRDFTGARAALDDAELKSKKAWKEATENRQAAATEAARAIATAEEKLAASEAFARAMHLGASERFLLQKSRIALAEARLYEKRGEFPLAGDRAGAAARQAQQVAGRAAQVASRYTEPHLVRSWRRMADDTIAHSRSTGGTAIVVYKEKHRLVLYQGGRSIRSYRAELGYNSIHGKMRAGDAATPEGRYRIVAKKGVGRSSYYKGLELDYPNAEDRARFERARRAGQLPRWAKVGGSIEIHGEGGRGRDWTRGCVALSNPDMDDVFSRVQVGTPVTIVGGDGEGGVFTELVREHRSSARTRTQ